MYIQSARDHPYILFENEEGNYFENITNKSCWGLVIYYVYLWIRRRENLIKV